MRREPSGERRWGRAGSVEVTLDGAPLTASVGRSTKCTECLCVSSSELKPLDMNSTATRSSVVSQARRIPQLSSANSPVRGMTRTSALPMTVSSRSTTPWFVCSAATVTARTRGSVPSAAIVGPICHAAGGPPVPVARPRPWPTVRTVAVLGSIAITAVSTMAVPSSRVLYVDPVNCTSATTSRSSGDQPQMAGNPVCAVARSNEPPRPPTVSNQATRGTHSVSGECSTHATAVPSARATHCCPRPARMAELSSRRPPASTRMTSMRSLRRSGSSMVERRHHGQLGTAEAAATGHAEFVRLACGGATDVRNSATPHATVTSAGTVTRAIRRPLPLPGVTPRPSSGRPHSGHRGELGRSPGMALRSWLQRRQ